MIDTLVVNVAPGETRIALLDGAAVVELRHHRAGRESIVGNLYLGRVTRLLSGANGAFIDIGEERPGFLNAGDARPDAHGPVSPIGRYVTEGAAVLVQVSRDALHRKGPRLTLRPSLVGRTVVFSPGRGGVEVSRRITGKAERARLARLLGEAGDGGDGFTLRSAAQGAAADRILGDMADLRDAWGQARRLSEKTSPPACLWTAPEPLAAAVADHPGLRRVVIDDAETLAAARRLMAGSDAALEPYRDDPPIFESFAVEAALEEAFEARLTLPSGGALIIEETHALCAIDVDGGGATGSASSLRVNLEAAEAIARQLRLRAIGGVIVIDFLRLGKRDHRRRVIAALAAALADDREAVAPEGFSRLGLVEMRRRRRRPSLAEILGEPGEVRKNPATAALDIGRAAARELAKSPPGAGALRVAPEVAAAFTPSLLAAVGKAAGRAVELTADAAYQRRDWRIDLS